MGGLVAVLGATGFALMLYVAGAANWSTATGLGAVSAFVAAVAVLLLSAISRAPPRAPDGLLETIFGAPEEDRFWNTRGKRVNLVALTVILFPIALVVVGRPVWWAIPAIPAIPAFMGSLMMRGGYYLVEFF